MAVANSLAAIQNGAGQIECTVNGLGERAGNASLEEIAMALHTRSEYYRAATALDTRHIYRASRLVSVLSGVVVQPNKAIVGDNAFAHESGIHQHGVLNNPLTYEIMRPESIGLNQNALILGKLSGRHAFEDRLKSLGYELDAKRIGELFVKFKDLADRKKMVFDRDIEALVTEKASAMPEWYRLVYHHVVSGNRTTATATVRVETDRGFTEQAACGDGPVDAAFKAIEKAVGFPVCLKDYQIKAVTAGEDALGEATVWLEQDGKVVSGRGLSTDIIEASARACMSAINKLIATCGHPAGAKAVGEE
jgi:2-isopropylmalate synthase